MNLNLTSIWSAIQAHAFLNFRKKRKDYLWGTLTLLVYIIAIRVFVPRPESVSHEFNFVPMWVASGFIFAWALQSAQTNAYVSYPSPPERSGVVFDSAYPRNYMCLPATNRTLVVAPMLLGPTVSLVIWILFCAVDVAPLRLPVPFLLPPLLFVTSISCTHALRWLMLWKPAKGGCLMPLSMVVFPAVGFAWYRGVSEAILNLLLLPLLVWSVRSALNSASKARQGVIEIRAPRSDDRRGWLRRILVPRPDGSGIASPTQAQAWLMERSIGGAGFAVVIGFIAAGFLLRIPFSNNATLVPIGIGSMEVGRITFETLLFLPAVLLLCTLCSQVLTVGLMIPGTTIKTKEKFPVLGQMHSIRPISTEDLERTVRLLSAKIAFRISVVALIGFCIWLCLPAHESGRVAPIAVLALHHVTARGVLIFLLAVAIFPALAWSLMLGSPLSYPWKEVKILRRLGNVAFPMFIGVTASQLGGHFFFGRHLDFPNPIEILLPLVPVAFGCLVVKVAFLYVGVRKARARELLSPQTLVQYAIGWVVAFLSLGGLGERLLPNVGLPASTIFLYLALLIPANRLIWPVLTIDAARHG